MDCKRVMSYPFGGRHAKQSKIKYKLEKLFTFKKYRFTLECEGSRVWREIFFPEAYSQSDMKDLHSGLIHKLVFDAQSFQGTFSMGKQNNGHFSLFCGFGFVLDYFAFCTVSK